VELTGYDWKGGGEKGREDIERMSQKMFVGGDLNSLALWSEKRKKKREEGGKEEMFAIL